MKLAEFSSCGKYRWVLRRTIPQNIRWIKSVLFIMLNPSTADETVDDATIRRCIAFAKAWGCTEMSVVNLYSYRATDPKELLLQDDPEGDCCEGVLESEIEKHRMGNSLIVAAWGASKFAKRRGEYVKNHYGPFLCLGKTKDGSPRHPLYVKTDTKLEDF